MHNDDERIIRIDVRTPNVHQCCSQICIRWSLANKPMDKSGGKKEEGWGWLARQAPSAQWALSLGRCEFGQRVMGIGSLIAACRLKGGDE